MKFLKNNLKKKSIILVNLLLILTLMTVSVYAWFASQVDNRVDAYEILVESDNALELSFDNSDNATWGGTLNLADFKENGASVLDTMKFVEVTGNGVDTFRIPQLTQKTNYAEVNTSGTWANAVKNQDYLEFTVYMRSKDQLSVYLSSDSSASPVSSVVTGATCGNPSTYASGENTFSKDCVVGALRVGYKNNADANYIWITNPEYQLKNMMGSSDYSMATNADSDDYNYSEGSNFQWNNTKTHYYYSGNNVTTFTNTFSEIDDSVTTKPTSDRTLIASLGGNPDEDGYYYDSVTFKVWIEGCDTEARRALVDGKFNLSLVFDTFGIQQ